MYFNSFKGLVITFQKGTLGLLPLLIKVPSFTVIFNHSLTGPGGGSKYNHQEECSEELGPTVSITFTQKTVMNIRVCSFSKIWARGGRESTEVEAKRWVTPMKDTTMLLSM